MGRYRIKAASRLTGVRPELLRIWEKRYPLFKPLRAGNRYREFDDDDIRLLVYIRQQIEQGRSIGELAAEGRERLLGHLAPDRPEGPSSYPNDTALIDEFLQYVQSLEKARLEARLQECAVHYPFATLLHRVFIPLMHRLGDLWSAGKLSRASEHFATALLQQRLLTALHSTAPQAQAPLLLCACPAGERHELGLLTLAYTLQQEGWQVCYLGADLPVRDVLYACQRLRPALVALSLTYTDGLTHCLEIVREVDAELAGTYPTMLGGQSMALYAAAIRPQHVQCYPTLMAARYQARCLLMRGSRPGSPDAWLGKVATDQ